MSGSGSADVGQPRRPSAYQKYDRLVYYKQNYQ